MALLGERAELAWKHLGKALRVGIFSHVVQGWPWTDAVAIPSSLGEQSLSHVGQQRGSSALLRPVFHPGEGFLVFFLVPTSKQAQFV